MAVDATVSLVRQASAYHQMNENYNCEDCPKYMRDEIEPQDGCVSECLSCGYQVVAIAGFMSLDILNEYRDNYNSEYDYVKGEDEYLPELTLEEYKLIAKKHHKPWKETTGGYHPYLYGLWTSRTEPDWYGG